MISHQIAQVETNQRLVDAAFWQFRHIDILVPNAGVLGLGGVRDAPLDAWQRTIDGGILAGGG